MQRIPLYTKGLTPEQQIQQLQTALLRLSQQVEALKGRAGKMSHDSRQMAGLADDTHTAYLPRDGTRTMTGNLDAGKQKVKNVALPTTPDEAVRLEDIATSDVSTEEVLESKGDIITMNDSGDVTNLGVGADNEVLTADSSQATGMKWATPSSGNETLTNKSGATTTVGYVYRIDPDNDNAFDYASEDEDAQVVVAQAVITDNASGEVKLSGYTDVYVNGDTTRGQFLYFSSTPGQAKPSWERKDGAFAQAMESRTGAGLVKAYVFQRERIRKWETRDKDSKRLRNILPIGRPTRRTSNPIIPVGTGWEANRVHFQCVLFDYEENIWKMWYTGWNTSLYAIGYATCVPADFPDTWTKYGSNPIITPRTNDGNTVRYPTVIKRDVTDYIMYVAVKGTNSGLWYLTSTDGINWSWGTKIASPGGTGWKKTYLDYPSVVKIGSRYYMLASGYNDTTANWTLGLFYSENGTTWIEYGANPIITLGAGGEWDDDVVAYATFFWDAGLIYILYSGDGGDGQYEIGHAVSNNLLMLSNISFIKDINNPTFSYNTVNGEWDDYSVIAPFMVKHEENFYMFYAGQDGTNKWQIGVAEWTP